MISMRGDVDVRGTVEIAFLLLLAVPTVPPPEKTSALAVPLHSRSLQIVTIVKELRFNISIDIDFVEGEKSEVVSQCLDQSFSSPFALRIHPSLRRSGRGQYRWLHDGDSIPRHFHRVRGWPTLQSREKTANKGNWPSV